MDLVSIPENPAPAGAVPARLRAIDGVPLRAVRWHPQGEARGPVLIAPGRAEYVEKYFETVGDLLSRGLVVVVFDWRGQGMSGRELDDRRKGHIDDFSLYLRDLDAILDQVLEPFCPKPWFALGHSMGGAILIDQARKGGSPFERLVLTAPMIGLRNLRFPTGARVLAGALDMLGAGGAFVPMARKVPYPLVVPFDNNMLTSDEGRYARMGATLRAAPHLGLGDPTIGWVNAAFRLMDSFADPEYPRRTLTPTLVVAAGDDRVVDTGATEHFASRLKAGRLLVLDHAAHEILMERDVFRERFWAAFDAFVPGQREEYGALLMADRAMRKSRRRWAWV